VRVVAERQVAGTGQGGNFLQSLDQQCHPGQDLVSPVLKIFEGKLGFFGRNRNHRWTPLQRNHLVNVDDPLLYK
jgi:hypothetical protein